MPTRTEEDFLGKVQVPAGAYYGAFTVRASSTFKLSGLKPAMRLIHAYALIKKAAALANSDLGLLDKKTSQAIVQAADEVIQGRFNDQFIIDPFQAGAGTPNNMNVNEVLANRATELLGGKKGRYLVHPNNHVNMAQSSNDVGPAAIRLMALAEPKPLFGQMKAIESVWMAKSKSYARLVKVGRTHLQDAVPITYGQVFEAYAQAVARDRRLLEQAYDALLELGIGGTALGTGITTHPKFKEKIVSHLSQLTGLELRIAASSVETTQNMNVFLQLSAALRNYAVTLNRIANDLRLLASGPSAGFGEILLPEVEPGSSIMPGKVNPSVPEAVNMLCWQVMGNDQIILQAVQSGQLELNFGTPLIAHTLLISLDLLTQGSRMFREKCLAGLKVDEKRCQELLDASYIYATALNPYLGYSAVSRLVREASEKKVSLKKLVLQRRLMDSKTLERVLGMENLTKPNLTSRNVK